MTHEPPSPAVGISACLLGERVRYDGAHKHAPALLAALEGRVRWVPICPEVEAGFGVPREPIRLEGPGPRVRGVASGADRTDALRDAARRLLDHLTAHGVRGLILKSRSPSCGLRDVPVFDDDAERPGRGVFAALVARERPEWVLVDETELASPAAARAFVARVNGYCS